MDARSFVVPTLAIGIAFSIGAGCTPKPCPPCEEATASSEEAKGSDGEPVSGHHYALPGLDHGLLQSPVNILSDETESGKHNIKFGSADEAEEVANLGTTVEVSFGRGITTEFDGKVYELLQLHFHTPAEHLIDGITYPMEVHVVHRGPGSAAFDPPSYLVISLLVRMGAENRFLAEFLNAVPPEKGQVAKVHDVFLHDMFRSGFDFENIHYYHYRGSLTTPPYTESVDWLVAKEVLEAAPAQIQRLNILEGDNARHVQALYRREIDG
jgi:carbonic anhydrase